MDKASKASKKKGRLNFPFRLHQLISQAAKLEVDDIICWDSTGKKFIIYDQNKFVEKVLPTVFKQSQFSSFRRQLNAYGFEREFMPNVLVKSGATCVAYVHQDFQRDDPEACRRISRRYSNQALIEGISRLQPDTPINVSNIFGSIKDEEVNVEALARMLTNQHYASNITHLLEPTPIDESKISRKADFHHLPSSSKGANNSSSTLSASQNSKKGGDETASIDRGALS